MAKISSTLIGHDLNPLLFDYWPEEPCLAQQSLSFTCLLSSTSSELLKPYRPQRSIRGVESKQFAPHPRLAAIFISGTIHWKPIIALHSSALKRLN